MARILLVLMTHLALTGMAWASTTPVEAEKPHDPVPLSQPGPDDPAEWPPEGFRAAQYIDSRGCVFIRDGDGPWHPRLAPDGGRICGYPPTLSLRELAPPPPAEQTTEDKLAHIDGVEAQLAAKIAMALGPAPVSDHAPAHESQSEHAPQKQAPHSPPAKDSAATKPAPSQPKGTPDKPASLADDIRAQMTRGAELRRIMAESRPETDRLCALLGAAPVGGQKGLHDGSFGHCGPLRDLPLPPLTGVAENHPPKDEAPKQTTPKLALAKGTDDKPRSKPAPSPATSKPSSQQTTQSAPPKKARSQQAAASQALLPAGARFVQIGVYADPANASRMVQKLAGMGFPVARTSGKLANKPAEIILAGPFEGRKAMIRAMDQIRQAGITDAFPR